MPFTTARTFRHASSYSTIIIKKPYQRDIEPGIKQAAISVKVQDTGACGKGSFAQILMALTQWKLTSAVQEGVACPHGVADMWMWG